MKNTQSPANAFKPRHYDESAAECRAAAGGIAWSQAILEHWPVPVSFEYWRLREELAAGQPLAAALQLKDLAEVLIKFPVVVAGKLLILHGDERQRAIARDLLISPTPPSLGAWRQHGGKLIRTAGELADAQIGPWRPVLEIAFSGQSYRESRFWRQLETLIPWRNKEIGHGALRLDLRGFADDMLRQIRGLHEELDKHAGAFAGIALRSAGEGGVLLDGYASLEEGQPALLAAIEGRLTLPLELLSGETRLLLGPYACLRYEKQDGAVGCYLINKRVDTRQKAKLHLLDYRSAATLVLGRNVPNPDLLVELDHLPESGSDEASREPPAGRVSDDEEREPPAGGISDNAVRAFLDATAFSREFIPPDYLHDVLRAFLGDPQRDHGLFWLSGAPDVGKTLFAYSLATLGSIAEIVCNNTRRSGPGPLGKAEVLVVPIRNAYRATPASLSSDVQTALDRSGDRQFLGLESQLKDAAYTGNPPAAFSAWLALLRRELRLPAATPFVLVLDGLDELPAPDPRVEGGSIADLLPTGDQLPTGVFLVLTSRNGDAATPREERCPDFVFAKLQRAHGGSSPPLRQHYQLLPEHNPDYRAVLRRYFDRQVENVLPDEQERSAAFAATLLASNCRFKQLSYFTALLGSGAVQPEDVEHLGAAPLEQHLHALARYEPARKFTLIRKILLELAAAEQAHLAEVKLMEPAPVIDREWLGVELLELADRVGYPASNPRELDKRFLDALYSVQELLRSYRGAAAPTHRFALGLKGMREQLQEIEGWDTGETLWRIFDDAFADWRAANDEAAENAALIRLGGPAAAFVEAGMHTPWEGARDFVTRCIYRSERQQDRLATTAAIRLTVTAEACASLALHPDQADDARRELQHQIAGAILTRGNARQSLYQLAEAVADHGRAIAIQEALRQALGDAWPPDFRNKLAGAYMNRGVALLELNQLAEAVADYGRAIAIQEALRQALGDDWPPDFRSDLANAYLNRGIALRDFGQPAEAVADHGRAIVIQEALRQALGDDWRPRFRNDLASAYMHRGNARLRVNQVAEAVADYGRAIKIQEALRQSLGDAWPPGFRNDLAGAYVNRGGARQYLNRLAEAVADYRRAIKIQEALRQELGDAWPPGFRNDLAGAYMGRGNARQDLNQLAEAVADYGRAIEIGESLRQALGDAWPPDFRNDLANAYLNRSNALQRLSQIPDAVADYGRAIAIQEALRQALGDAWPPGFRNDLANVFMNRGNALQGLNQLAEAVAAYGRAIEIREALRQDLGDAWPPGLRNDLANAYTNRGNVLQDLNQLAEALADYGRTIAIQDALRQKLGDAWPPAFRNDLANTYRNRALVLEKRGQLADAAADRARANEIDPQEARS